MSSSSLLVEETATGLTCSLQFRDSRCPLLVQVAMEREVMVPFAPSMIGERLELRAQASLVGALYEFRLTYEMASTDWNQYSLHLEVIWANQPAGNSDYYRKTSVSWFDLWTRQFEPVVPNPGEENNLSRYSLRCQEVLLGEQLLSSVQSIQALIIRAVQNGARFRTSHKEGGTDIYWRDGHYVRTDYGDNPSSQRFSTDAEFLVMLFDFFRWQVTRNAVKAQLSEVDIWRLILRLLRNEDGGTI